MNAARNARDFKASDAIRLESPTAGILVENTKTGSAGGGSKPTHN